MVSLLALLAISAAPRGGAKASPEESVLAWWRADGQPPADYVISKSEEFDWVFLGEYHRIRAMT